MSDPLFDDHYLDRLIARAAIRSFPKNALLIQEGDRSDQLYFACRDFQATIGKVALRAGITFLAGLNR